MFNRLSKPLGEQRSAKNGEISLEINPHHQEEYIGPNHQRVIRGNGRSMPLLTREETLRLLGARLTPDEIERLRYWSPKEVPRAIALIATTNVGTKGRRTQPAYGYVLLEHPNPGGKIAPAMVVSLHVRRDPELGRQFTQTIVPVSYRARSGGQRASDIHEPLSELGTMPIMATRARVQLTNLGNYNIGVPAPQFGGLYAVPVEGITLMRALSPMEIAQQQWQRSELPIGPQAPAA